MRDPSAPQPPPAALHPQMRAERLIAGSRAVLAAAALLAIAIDPSQPRFLDTATQAALAAYLAYALALCVFLLRRAAVPPGLPLATHAGDVVVFVALFVVTEGPGSPFYLFFVFTVLGAGLRWQWLGTLWTTAVLMTAYLAVGAYEAHVLGFGELERAPYLVRGAFLMVTAVLMGALGTYETRLRREMLLLAVWPREVPRDPERVLRESLAHAADVLRCPRVVAVWEPGEEPYRHVASWSRGSFEQSAEPPEQWEPLVPPRLASATFLCNDLAAAMPRVLRVSHGQMVRELALAPLDEGFRRRYGARRVLSAPIHGQSLRGRLFWLDVRAATADDLVLADILAAQMTARIDRAHLFEVLRETAAADERMRIARDLHDGLLQSLTAAGLQIAAARTLIARRAPADAEKLARVQQAIASEQRDLRAFIRHLKPSGGDAPDTAPAPEADLKNRLRELARKFEQLWGVEMTLRTGGLDAPITPSLARHAFLMVNEAVSNAARHGNASHVRVDVEVLADQVCISVSDDGTGFLPGELARGGAPGPASLTQRVAELGGSLTVDSTGEGARVRISVPLEA